MNTAGGVDSDLVTSPTDDCIDADMDYNSCVDTDGCRVIYSEGRGYIYIYVHLCSWIRGSIYMYPEIDVGAWIGQRGWIDRAPSK